MALKAGEKRQRGAHRLAAMSAILKYLAKMAYSKMKAVKCGASSMKCRRNLSSKRGEKQRRGTLAHQSGRNGVACGVSEIMSIPGVKHQRNGVAGAAKKAISGEEIAKININVAYQRRRPIIWRPGSENESGEESGMKESQKENSINENMKIICRHRRKKEKIICDNNVYQLATQRKISLKCS
jgi:hypothetical protein